MNLTNGILYPETTKKHPYMTRIWHEKKGDSPWIYSINKAPPGRIGGSEGLKLSFHENICKAFSCYAVRLAAVVGEYFVHCFLRTAAEALSIVKLRKTFFSSSFSKSTRQVPCHPFYIRRCQVLCACFGVRQYHRSCGGLSSAACFFCHKRFPPPLFYHNFPRVSLPVI